MSNDCRYRRVKQQPDMQAHLTCSPHVPRLVESEDGTPRLDLETPSVAVCRLTAKGAYYLLLEEFSDRWDLNEEQRLAVAHYWVDVIETQYTERDEKIRIREAFEQQGPWFFKARKNARALVGGIQVEESC